MTESSVALQLQKKSALGTSYMREAGSLLAQLGVLKIVKSGNIFSLYDEKNVSFYDFFKFQRLVSLLHFFLMF